MPLDLIVCLAWISMQLLTLLKSGLVWFTRDISSIKKNFSFDLVQCNIIEC